MFSNSHPAATISVIVPVYNGSATLRRCLDAVIASGDSACECIVVDDGSTDESQAFARQYPVRVLQISGGPLGPAHARNCGAEVARGKVLFFVDADVVLAQGALDRVQKTFEKQPEIVAVFGSYDANPPARGIVSQYRNLLHHFIHQNSSSDASTFWAGCGAIRRAVFEAVGGFDEQQFSRPSIEDIELGYRLRRSRYRILLDKELQGTHLKPWSFFSLVRTDIICRALPWSRLILQTRNMPDDLNLRWAQRASFLLAALACAFLALSIVRSEWLAGSAAALFGVIVLNRKLYAFFLRERGILFATACVPLHLLYYLYSGLSYIYVWAGVCLHNFATLRRSSAMKTAAPSFKNQKP